VFLDRDGVVNRAVVVDGRPLPPRSAEELELLPGVADACTVLRDAGFALVVVTNQPDIARGTTTREAVDEIHAVLRRQVTVDDIVVCPHDDADRCDCRKPKPGMLLDAAHRHDIDLTRSFMVGDRWRDVDAGRAAGSRTVFVDRGYDERRPELPDHIAASLPEAVPWILKCDATHAREQERE
jgi:D-glycero-D-manno-heptose 1,7-bisphosphate phosphatase